MDQINDLLQRVQGVYAIPPPPPENVLFFLAGLLSFAIFLAILPRVKWAVRNTYYRVRGLFWRGKTRPMNDSERERQIIANIIVDALEEAEVQGVISRRGMNKAYARLAKAGYPDLQRKRDLYKRLFGKLHPYKISKLKHDIKERVMGGAKLIPKHKGLTRLDALEVRAGRKLRVVS